MNRKLMNELRLVGPVLGVSGDRVAYGGRHKTDKGQWVSEGGVLEWVGDGDPALPPESGVVAAVHATIAAHVPDPPRVRLDTKKLLAKSLLDIPLTAEERTEVQRWLSD